MTVVLVLKVAFLLQMKHKTTFHVYGQIFPRYAHFMSMGRYFRQKFPKGIYNSFRKSLALQFFFHP